MILLAHLVLVVTENHESYTHTHTQFFPLHSELNLFPPNTYACSLFYKLFFAFVTVFLSSSNSGSGI